MILYETVFNINTRLVNRLEQLLGKQSNKPMSERTGEEESELEDLPQSENEDEEVEGESETEDPAYEVEEDEDTGTEPEKEMDVEESPQ